MLNEGMNFLETALMESAVRVTYRRGQTDYPVQAVRGGVSWNDLGRVGSGWSRTSSRDYICRKSSLGEIAPAMGDVLIDEEDVWKVYRMDDEECWRPIGSGGLIRIHTKKVNG